MLEKLQSFKPIQPGATIAIVSPASHYKEEKMKRGIDYLHRRGYKTVLAPNHDKKNKYLTGHGPEQVEDLHWAFSHPDVDAIICTRGGYGTPRYLDKLDYDLIKNHPKPFVGYSDITALQCAIMTQAQLMTLSGAMVAVEMGDENGIDPYTEAHFWPILENGVGGQVYHNPEEEPITVLSPGVGEGRLVGGCFALVNNIMGTKYFPPMAGNILVLEDIGENVQHFDRMLTQFRLAGIFDQINGLILGQFIDCWENAEPDDFSMEEIVRDVVGKRHYPIFANVAYGHGRRKMALPLGAQVRMDAESQTIAFL